MELIGDPSRREPPRSTSDALGAVATVTCGGRRRVTERIIGAGMGTHGSASLSFALDRCAGPVSIEVKFPSGVVQRAAGLAVDARYRVDEKTGLESLGGFVARPAPASAPMAVSAALAPLFDGAPGEPRFVLEELWATWCESCLRERPRLEHLHGTLGEAVALRGSSVEPKDDAAAVRAYVEKHRTGHPLRPFDAKRQPAIEAALGGAVRATPSTLLLDRRDRRVLWAGPGLPSVSAARRALAAAAP